MASKRPLIRTLQKSMIKDVPSYGNKFFYSLGFLSAISFIILIITGVIMAFYGPDWWLTSGAGKYLRSVHLWATQAFVLFVLLHLVIVFFTSGFKKPRRLTWVLGVLMLFTVLAETEFGYVLRGDYSSQWRALQGADFYNGSGLGWWINSLNAHQIYGIHIVIVPLVVIGLLGLHYLLVRVFGIAKPYRADVAVRTVPANHKVLFARGGVLTVLVLVLAAFLPSPYLKPTTIQFVANQDPMLFGKTVVAEFDRSSDTATYVDSLAPYVFDTRQAYVQMPYNQLHSSISNQTNDLAIFSGESTSLQTQQLTDAANFYGGNKGSDKVPTSPVMNIVATLTDMAQSGLYESALVSEHINGSNFDGQTYRDRFLADTGVLEDKAISLGITTEQYGMIREESGRAPGAWWLAPIGLLNHTVLANDNNGDRDGAIIFGSLLLTMLAFPFIPYVNQIPDKLKVYKFIWREKKSRK
jgi:ubiquinol-cytochrome c reductase cytochrome b subunit